MSDTTCAVCMGTGESFPCVKCRNCGGTGNPERRQLSGPRGYRVSLDRGEVFPDDPGQGAPAMVYGPTGEASGTYWCVSDTGEIEARGEYWDVPKDVLAWLGEIEGDVNAFLYGEDTDNV